MIADKKAELASHQRYLNESAKNTIEQRINRDIVLMTQAEIEVLEQVLNGN